MSNASIINLRPVKADPPDTRVVEVHMTDGGSVWVLVDAADFDHANGAIHARRPLRGRLVGDAGVNGRGILIPAERIQMVMDVDG